MGLISEIVEVKWHPVNKKWYESKGYSYTKMGEGFEVKVEDLTKGNNVLVEVKCDGECCKDSNSKLIKWIDYLKQVREDDKYYCLKCAMKLYGGENSRKTKLRKGKSFKQWCIENDYQDILNRWDYDLNNCKPDEILYTTHKKYYLKCPNNVHKSELNNIASFTSGQKMSMNCKACNSFAQWGIDNIGEDFLDKYWDWDKNTVNPWEIPKRSNYPKVWIKCQEKDYHGSYKVFCSDFINGNRCPYCTHQHGKVHPLDSLGQFLEDEGLLHLWSDKNKRSPYEYTSKSHQKVYWKCPDGTHEDFPRKIYGSNRYNFRCPDCSRERKESFLQGKVRLYLESSEYTILHEFNCTIIPQNLKNKGSRGSMPFDNEIKELKFIIEVHGVQHYEVCSWHKKSAKKNNTTPEQELEHQQLKDKYKKDYALSQGYFYLEIPYWTDDKKETWKKLIDDKICQILNCKDK